MRFALLKLYSMLATVCCTKTTDEYGSITMLFVYVLPYTSIYVPAKENVLFAVVLLY